MNKKPELYISVDTEASGPIPGEYSLLSIGACVVGEATTSFYIELKPLSMHSTKSAIAVTGFDMELLTKTGIEPISAMLSFEGWIKGLVGEKYRPVMVGFNAPFDWSFINWYMLKFLDRNILGICAIDIKAYIMGMCKLQWGETTKRKMPKEFRSVLPHTHNAMDDAKEQSDIFEKVLRENSQFDKYISDIGRT